MASALHNMRASVKNMKKKFKEGTLTLGELGQFCRKDFSNKSKELEIYGPECIHEEFNLAFTLILPGSKIALNNGYVEVFGNNCWKFIRFSTSW